MQDHILQGLFDLKDSMTEQLQELDELIEARKAHSSEIIPDQSVTDTLRGVIPQILPGQPPLMPKQIHALLLNHGYEIDIRHLRNWLSLERQSGALVRVEGGYVIPQ